MGNEATRWLLRKNILEPTPVVALRGVMASSADGKKVYVVRDE